MMNYLEKSYDILKRIFSSGAFVQIALNENPSDQGTSVVTKIVYGTLENYFLLNYNIALYTSKKPQNSVNILLLIALYCLKFMNIPDYAIVNGIVELTEKIGKKELKPFVNGILRKLNSENLKYPEIGSMDYQQVKYNLPKWFIEEVKLQYKDQYESILNVKGGELEHVRLNQSRISIEEFESLIEEKIPTKTGYLVHADSKIRELFAKGKLTYQSLASTLVVESVEKIKDKKVLDLCAAPGGKAVMCAEKGAIVSACDLYPHRLELIKSYSKRMGVDLSVLKNDATFINSNFILAYDVVFVDAPCSGLGVIKKKQDMIIGKKLSDVFTLSVLQKKILDVSKLYVKVGGLLVYSTCTIMRNENGDVIKEFLQKNPNYVIDKDSNNFPNSGEIQLLPDNNGMDGYYIARLRRVS